MKFSIPVFLLALSLLSGIASGQPLITHPIIIGESVSVHSSILNEERKLNVYLPEGYQQNDSVPYPVVYLLDGSMDEDFLHIVGLYQFGSFPWINWCQPSIVVGIVNTDRMRDMTYPTRDTMMKRLYPSQGGSEKFIHFLKDELQPFIKSRYKVSKQSSLIGQSLGGLLATEMLLKQPSLFDTYFIVSPSLWWDDGSLLDYKTSLTDVSYGYPTKIFLAVGKEGLTPGTHAHVEEVDVNLLADKIKKSKSPGVKVIFDYLPEEDHATILHRAMLDGIRALNEHTLH